MRKNKCPKCGCEETYKQTFRHDQGFIEEQYERCKNCDCMKNMYSYGDMLVTNWKEIQPPVLYRLKQWIKNIFKKKHNKDEWFKEETK